MVLFPGERSCGECAYVRRLEDLLKIPNGPPHGPSYFFCFSSSFALLGVEDVHT